MKTMKISWIKYWIIINIGLLVFACKKDNDNTSVNNIIHYTASDLMNFNFQIIFSKVAGYVIGNTTTYVNDTINIISKNPNQILFISNIYGTGPIPGLIYLLYGNSLYDYKDTLQTTITVLDSMDVQFSSQIDLDSSYFSAFHKWKFEKMHITNFTKINFSATLTESNGLYDTLVNVSYMPIQKQ